jgi:predicted nicotinamide N-methyase
MPTCFGDIVINENTNMQHSGARVWSSSHVLTKYLEKHRRKLKLKGKVLELGAGCGMNGIMMSKCGCDMVVFTDIAPVIDHLTLNVERNLSNPLKKDSTKNYAIRELEWENEEQCKRIKDEFGNFQFIIGSDVVYQEEHIHGLLKVLKYFTETYTSASIIIAYEIRNDSAHEMFLEECSNYEMDVKEIPLKQQHEEYQEELVLIYHLRRVKPSPSE